MKLKTSFIKSLNPRREYILWGFICNSREVIGYLSVWLCKVTLIYQIQCGSVFSSVILQNDLIHTRILLGDLTERAGTSDSVANNTEQGIWFVFIWKGKLFSSATGAAENTYMTQEQKSRQTNKQTSIKKKSILRQNGKTRSGRWPVMTRDNCSQL